VDEWNENATNSWKIVIGIIGLKEMANIPNMWIGRYSGCGYIADEGRAVNVECSDAGKEYSYTYGEGSVIGVLISYDHRLICFFNDGEFLGVAFKESPELLKLFVSKRIDCEADSKSGEPYWYGVSIARTGFTVSIVLVSITLFIHTITKEPSPGVREQRMRQLEESLNM
jgi:hypothetical protein